MTNHNSFPNHGGRVTNLEQAHREASRGQQVVIVTTKISLNKRDNKPCGVFATIAEGPLAGYSGMIYIGDIATSPGKPSAQSLDALVNPAGQRLVASIKDAQIEDRATGGKRLKLNFWKCSPEAVTKPAATSELSETLVPQAAAVSTQSAPELAPLAVTRDVQIETVALQRRVVTVFLDSETKGLHTCKVTSVREGTASQVLELHTCQTQTLEGALTTALALAQEHKVHEIEIVDPERRLFTTGDRASIRVAHVRNLWLPSAKRKDAKTVR